MTAWTVASGTIAKSPIAAVMVPKEAKGCRRRSTSATWTTAIATRAAADHPAGSVHDSKALGDMLAHAAATTAANSTSKANAWPRVKASRRSARMPRRWCRPAGRAGEVIDGPAAIVGSAPDGGQDRRRQPGDHERNEAAMSRRL